MEAKKYPLWEVRIRLEKGMGLYSGEKITSADKAVEVMQRELSGYDREVVCIVNLNISGQPMNFNIVSMGTLGASLVDVANVLKSAILSNAASFILLHNHPSGDTSPSKYDLDTTKRLILAGCLMGIPLVDHVIVGAGGKEIYSMREHNDMNFEPGYEQAFEGGTSQVAQTQTAYATPFGDVDREAADEAAYKSAGRMEEEITLHFGKGLCQFFTSKKGSKLARIKIPDASYGSWPSFVVPANLVHDNRYGKGFWLKVPAGGKTTLSISKRVTYEDGSSLWKDTRMEVDNSRLKEMVEAYKKDAPEKNAPDEAQKRKGR